VNDPDGLEERTAYYEDYFSDDECEYTEDDRLEDDIL
jgi:hypothetical protein